MKKILKKAFIFAGVATGLAASFLPLTSYAVEYADNPTTKPVVEKELDMSRESKPNMNASVSVTVKPVLTLDVSVDSPASATNTMAFTVSPNTISKGTFSAKVSSNAIYKLYVNAKDGQTDMLRSGDTSDSVYKIPGNGIVEAGKNGWGIKLSGADAYGAIPATMSTPFYTSTAPVSSNTTTFDVGISVGSNLAAGTYAATLVVTATNG